MIKNASQAILDGLIEEDDYEMLFSIEPMPKYVVALDASVSDGGVDIVILELPVTFPCQLKKQHFVPGILCLAYLL